MDDIEQIMRTMSIIKVSSKDTYLTQAVKLTLKPKPLLTKFTNIITNIPNNMTNELHLMTWCETVIKKKKKEWKPK